MFLFTSYSQLPEFGKISIEDLSNKPYKPDPGADAIVISDIAIAGLGYDERDFFVEMHRDIRIRIVNSAGYDYADVAIPFRDDEKISSYRASTFNLKNGVKVETALAKKDFIIEKTSESSSTLKFNFPDVHEGSVIEYTYKIRLGSYSKFVLVPWTFQREIPIVLSSLVIEYPDAFAYKYSLTGNLTDINHEVVKGNKMFLKRWLPTNINMWTAGNVPAFKEEPYILGRKEYVSKPVFELARIDLPEMSTVQVTPSYTTLTEKLLERSDFGTPMDVNLTSLTKKIVGSETDNLLKLKAIHKYITSNIFWNGDEDFMTSTNLRKVLNERKGNSADINLLLIAMAKSAGISSEPVILSTRSNGSLNTISALIQQFNYVIARISIDGNVYLVDATDPLRPFNELPFNCLNKTGRLISKTESKFIDLINNEKRSVNHKITVNPGADGSLEGTMENVYSGYPAFNVRNFVKLESEEGYLDHIKSVCSDVDVFDFKLEGLHNTESEIKETISFTIPDGSQVAGDEILINPYLMRTSVTNPFFQAERKIPIDFGCPEDEGFEMTLKIPDGYDLISKPDDLTVLLGKEGGSFSFKCQQTDNILKINSLFKIDRIFFATSEYKDIQKFYLKIQKKQSELIILKKI